MYTCTMCPRLRSHVQIYTCTVYLQYYLAITSLYVSHQYTSKCHFFRSPAHFLASLWFLSFPISTPHMYIHVHVHTVVVILNQSVVHKHQEEKPHFCSAAIAASSCSLSAWVVPRYCHPCVESERWNHVIHILWADELNVHVLGGIYIHIHIHNYQ